MIPLHDIYLRHNKKKREFVAGLLPRVAMLPLRHIYYLEDDEVKSIDREFVEEHIGGIAVARQPDGRLVIHNSPVSISILCNITACNPGCVGSQGATPDARKFCTGSVALCKECIAEASFYRDIPVKRIGTTIAFP